MIETWLRAFNAVARYQGFTRAAAALYVTQPTVTEQVKSLEQYFGVELFTRKGRSTHLTEIGERLYELTQLSVGYTEEAVALLKGESIEPSGKFSVASISPYEIIPLISKVIERHPNLIPTVGVEQRDDILQGLLDFRIDIAIVDAPSADNRFKSVPHQQREVKLLIPKRHPLANSSKISLKKLENAPMILRESEAATRSVFELAMQEKGLQYQRVMEVDNRGAIREAVAKGLGIGLTSDAGEHSLPNHLCAKPFSPRTITYQTHMVCLAARSDRPLIREFLDLAEEG